MTTLNNEATNLPAIPKQGFHTRSIRRATPEVILEIKTLWHAGQKLEEIAEKTGVSLTRAATALHRAGILTKEEAKQTKTEATQRRSAARRTKRLGTTGIPAEMVRDIQTRSSGICECCKTTPGRIKDHIVPIQMGGRNETGNLQLLCDDCNAVKTHYMDRMLRAMVIARRARNPRKATKGLYLYNALAEILRTNKVAIPVSFVKLRQCRTDFFDRNDHLRLKQGTLYRNGARSFLRNEETTALFRAFYTPRAPVVGANWGSCMDFPEIPVEGGKPVLVTSVTPQYADAAKITSHGKRRWKPRRPIAAAVGDRER